MYFALRTENELQKEQVEKVIEQMKKEFGDSNVSYIEYGMFTTIETRNVSGLVDFATTHSFSLFTDIGENAKKMRIDLDLVDVVYDLNR